VVIERLDCGVCVVRTWTGEDVPALAAVASDWGIARYMADRFPHPYTLDDARYWIGLNTNEHPTHFAIEIDGEVAGGVGYDPLEGEKRHTMHVGYWLAPRFWGRGIMTAACRALCNELFAMNGVVRLEAIVYAPNVGSARVLEKCGFVREGTLRKAAVKGDNIYDVHYYAKVRE